MFSHDTQMLKDILTYYNINPDNSHLFTHAYEPEKLFDEESCLSYFNNGIRLKNGVHSMLSTIEPLKKTIPYENSLTRISPRGNHKIIVSIPYELDNMFLGSTLTGSGDAGNQYSPHHLLDYLIDSEGLTAIPKEFIVGAYIADYSDEINPQESVFIPNANFYGNVNSKSNIESLKTTLINAYDNSSTEKTWLGYCFGLNDLDEKKFNQDLELIRAYNLEKRFDILIKVVKEKMQREKEKQENYSQPY